MIHKFLTYGKFLECDKQNYGTVKQTRCRVVCHILETCHTSKNLWIIENFAGFKFCSLRVSPAKSQWARLVSIIKLMNSRDLTFSKFNKLARAILKISLWRFNRESISQFVLADVHLNFSKHII